jgi:hypothetical protein
MRSCARTRDDLKFDLVVFSKSLAAFRGDHAVMNENTLGSFSPMKPKPSALLNHLTVPFNRFPSIRSSFTAFDNTLTPVDAPASIGGHHRPHCHTVVKATDTSSCIEDRKWAGFGLL